MAQKKEVTKNFSRFKKGEVLSFSDEMCKKYADFLKEPTKKRPKKEKE